MPSIFFSYSHRDESLRDELETHLAMLKRQGVIDTWHDRRIVAGDEFTGSISEHLELADIILLLVSPYFLASDYCYDVEMRRAMERHNAGDARVIPIILHPCDWHSAPFGKLLASPTDGKPISKFANPHEAYLDVVQAIRRALESRGQRSSAPSAPSAFTATPPTVISESRSSNLRLKKAFSDHDRDTFLDESFEFIAKFFEASLIELQNRNPGITVRFRRVDAVRFSAFVYAHGKAASECGVRLGGVFGPCISFCFDASAENSSNESLSAENDGHIQFLRPTGFSMFSDRSNHKLTQQGAAELLWAMLIRPLQD